MTPDPTLPPIVEAVSETNQPSRVIHVSDDAVAPIARLCWHQGPAMVRCDRRAGHAGLHTYEWANLPTLRTP